MRTWRNTPAAEQSYGSLAAICRGDDGAALRDAALTGRLAYQVSVGVLRSAVELLESICIDRSRSRTTTLAVVAISAPSEVRGVRNRVLLEKPSAITFAARPEQVEALPGAKRGSPGVITDQAKLPATHSTVLRCGTALRVFQAIAHAPSFERVGFLESSRAIFLRPPCVGGDERDPLFVGFVRKVARSRVFSKKTLRGSPGGFL